MTRTVAVRSGLITASILATVGFAIAVARPSGIAFWTDSVAYFAAAESIPHGAFQSHQNHPLTLFPPVYPLSIALALAIGFDRQTAAFLVNLVAVAAMAAIVCRAAWSRTGSVGPTLAIVLTSLVLGPVSGRYRFAGSELPFMALTLLALDQTDRRVWRRGALHAFGLGLVCSLAFLTRYSGLVVVGIVAIWVLADTWRVRSSGVSTPLWFTAGVAPLSAAWLLRNYLVDGSPMGRRGTTVASVPETLTGAASSVVGWVMPGVWWANSPLEWMIVFCALIAVMIAAIFVARHYGREISATVFLYLVFAIAYVAFIAVSSLLAPIDTINERLLAPAYVPFVIGVGIAVAASTRRVRERWRRTAAWAGAVGVALVVVLAVAQVHLRPQPERQLNYMSDMWRDSPTTHAARAIDHSGSCFTNAPPPLYMWTGLRCNRALTKLYRTVGNEPDPLLELLKRNDADGVYYIWYHDNDPQGLIGNPSKLLAGHVKAVVRTRDGEIFELGAQPVQTSRVPAR